MVRELRILLLEDNPADADLIRHELWKANIKFSLKQVETKEAFLKELKDFTPGLILSDNSLPSFDGISALTMAKEKCPDVPFIFVSGTLGEERAIITLKSGATNYILKERLSRLGPVVRRSLNEADERKAYRQTEEALRDTRAILDGIFDSAMDAIISVDTEQRILLFNKAAERMFRCSVIDAIGQPIDRFIPELISFASREHKQGLGRTWVVDPIIGEQRLLSGIRSDGEEFPIEASISRVKAFEQYIYTFILRDVTARKRAEELQGYYIHLSVYVAVNLGLFLINSLTRDGGTWWFYWPMLGWGIGLVVHTLVTFGGGVKARGGTSKAMRASERHWASTDSRP